MPNNDNSLTISMKMPTQEAFQTNWCLHVNEKRKKKQDSIISSSNEERWMGIQGGKERETDRGRERFPSKVSSSL